jgi:hypothetical protein
MRSQVNINGSEDIFRQYSSFYTKTKVWIYAPTVNAFLHTTPLKCLTTIFQTGSHVHEDQSASRQQIMSAPLVPSQYKKHVNGVYFSSLHNSLKLLNMAPKVVDIYSEITSISYINSSYYLHTRRSQLFTTLYTDTSALWRNRSQKASLPLAVKLICSKSRKLSLVRRGKMEICQSKVNLTK